MASYGGVEKIPVQELAKDGLDPPQEFILSEEERPIDASPPTTPIPAVDLQLLFSLDGDSRMREMDKLMSALKSWGLFQAVGHGIPTSLIDNVGRIARDYFDLPKEKKEKFTEAVWREGDEIAPEEEIRDWCDHLYLLVLPEDQRDTSLWPENPGLLREILLEFTKKIKAVIEVTLKAMGKLLELEENYFLKQFDDKATVYARFNYYPRCSRPDLVNGIKPHADGSGITILLPDQMVDGLEVCKDGKWVKVRALPYALIINVGDQMEVMSNGIFRSPVHRAVTNSVKDRISLAMFLAADAKKEIGPADGLVDDENGQPRLFKKFKLEEYLQIFYHSFKQGKRSIDWAKV